jgi:hypothetical protein
VFLKIHSQGTLGVKVILAFTKKFIAKKNLTCIFGVIMRVLEPPKGAKSFGIYKNYECQKLPRL